MRGETEAGELSRPPNGLGCSGTWKKSKPLVFIVENAIIGQYKCTVAKAATQASTWLAHFIETRPVPKPIIIQEADTVHARDESQSCHASVSHCDGGKANYRWLKVPFFSPPLHGQAGDEEGIRHVRRRLPLIVLLIIPPGSSEDHQPHRYLKKKKKWLTPLAIIYFKQLQESCILIEILRSYTRSHAPSAEHKQSRAAIPNPIVVNMKPASFRRWGVFGPHIPIRPVSKAIAHNAARRTAAEQDFDFPQCDL